MFSRRASAFVSGRELGHAQIVIAPPLAERHLVLPHAHSVTPQIHDVGVTSAEAVAQTERAEHAGAVIRRSEGRIVGKARDVRSSALWHTGHSHPA